MGKNIASKWTRRHSQAFTGSGTTSLPVSSKSRKKTNTAISISISTVWTRLLSSNCSVVETPPVRKAKVKDGGVLFMDLKPDKYYARIVIDTNSNGVWDTGNYIEKATARRSLLFSPKMYEIMQNWQVEETWNVNSTPLAKQKPLLR